MSCPFYYAQIVSVFSTTVSSVIAFMSSLKCLLFRLNNLAHSICMARLGSLDFAFSLLSKTKLHLCFFFVVVVWNKESNQGEKVLCLAEVCGSAVRRHRFLHLTDNRSVGTLQLRNSLYHSRMLLLTPSQVVISTDPISVHLALCVAG